MVNLGTLTPKCPFKPATAVVSLVISSSKALFYYIGMNGCARYNEAVIVFIVLPEVLVIQILLAIYKQFQCTFNEIFIKQPMKKYLSS